MRRDRFQTIVVGLCFRPRAHSAYAHVHMIERQIQLQNMPALARGARWRTVGVAGW